MKWQQVLWLIFLWPGSALASEAALSLEQAVSHALEQAPQLGAQAARVEAAQSLAESAGRLPDPELITGIDNLPLDTADRFSLSRDFMTMRRIGVMQSFPNGAKRRLAQQRARQETDIASAELHRTRFETIQAVAAAWIETAVAEQSLLRLRRLETETLPQSAIARAAVASGRASVQEALTAQLLVARLQERIRAQAQQLEIRRAELARWIGDEAQRPLASLPTDDELAAALKPALSEVSQHALLAPLAARLAAAQTDVALARAEKRPDWSAEVSYAKRGPDFSNMLSLGFRVGLPLFATHRQNPLIAEKLAAVRAQQAENESETRRQSAQLRSAMTQLRHGRERLRHYTTELLPLARDRSRAAVSAYGAGRGDARSTLDALTEQFNTEIEELELQGAVAQAWAYLHFLPETEIAP